MPVSRNDQSLQPCIQQPYSMCSHPDRWSWHPAPGLREARQSSAQALPSRQLVDALHAIARCPPPPLTMYAYRPLVCAPRHVLPHPRHPMHHARLVATCCHRCARNVRHQTPAAAAVLSSAYAASMSSSNCVPSATPSSHVARPCRTALPGDGGGGLSAGSWLLVGWRTIGALPLGYIGGCCGISG